jgi:hypothetical protein
MDSEATVILRRPAASPSGPHGMTAVTAPSRTSRSESTAVFIGRASFQMIPALHAGRQIRAAVPVEPTGMVVTPPLATIVVEDAMTPPPVVDAQGAPMLLQAAPSGMVLRLFSPSEVTEPIQVHARSARARGPITARALRTVVVALIAGATITLSAEAVMRWPATVEAPKVAAPSARPQLGGAPVVPMAPTEVVLAAPPPIVPTVVASTAPVAPAEPAAPAVRRPSPQRGRQRLRATPSHAGLSLAIEETAHGTRTTATAAWVDPFAPLAEPAASKTSATAWVDPFAN